MQNTFLSVRDYHIKSSDVFFFDNNIWMYLACPLGNYALYKQKAYSGFYSYVLERKNQIFINSLVLAEFSNRFLKLDFNLRYGNRAKQYHYKKDYVGTKYYLDTIAVINAELHKIVSFCTRCSDEFNAINFEEVLQLFNEIGFNDSYYCHLAASKKWIIVTDDSDFSKGKIPDLGLTILKY